MSDLFADTVRRRNNQPAREALEPFAGMLLEPFSALARRRAAERRTADADGATAGLRSIGDANGAGSIGGAAMHTRRAPALGELVNGIPHVVR